MPAGLSARFARHTRHASRVTRHAARHEARRATRHAARATRRCATPRPRSVTARRGAPTIGGVFDEQAGAVTRRQLIAAGVTEETVRAHLRAGRRRRAFPGVFRTFSGPPSSAATLWAALLTAGRGAVSSHETAAALGQGGRPATPTRCGAACRLQ